MKLNVFILFFFIFQATAGNLYSQTTKLSLNMENAAIADVFDAIERQSDFYFFYDRNHFNDKQRVTVKLDNTELEEILRQVLSRQQVSYEISGRNIIIRADPNVKNSNQSEITVRGKVTSESGEAVPGVSVIIRGTSTGTITDGDGAYSLRAAGNSVLIFSFVGMKSQEVSVSGRQTIDIVMEEETIGLEEVVAIGYGTVKKSDLTGSVGSVGNEKLTVKGTTSPMQAIQGQVAGVNITASSGRAGADYNIQIRGVNTIREADELPDPLYVVDGVVTGNIQFLNPQDIERIDILKDASSTAIYGSRGSNGVVIVTTKQASEVKDGKPVITYDGYYGVRQATRLPDLMDGAQYWEYRQNAYLGAEAKSGNDLTQAKYDQAWLNARTSYDKSPSLRYRLENGISADWVDLMVEDGAQQNHWLSISGKSAGKMSYLFGLGYQNEDGIFYNESYDRYNFKASIHHEISDKWSAGTNINVAFTTRELGGDYAVRDAFVAPPVTGPYGLPGFPQEGELLVKPGNYDGLLISGAINPILNQQQTRNNLRSFDALGNIYLQYSPVKGLSLKTTLSPRIRTSRQGQYQGSETAERALRDPAAQLTQNTLLTYTWDNQLTFDKTINDHAFNFVALQSIYELKEESSFISVENLPFESLWHNAGSAPDIVEVNSGYSKQTLVSFLGRLNYSYMGKYLLTASLRADGSSKLAAGHKWASFPSAAAAWRISEESFLKELNLLSNLKLRASYGYTGNNNIGPYSTQMLATNQRYYDFGGVVANGFGPGGIANTRLSWEKTRELNLGLDFGLFGGRISGSVDVYDRLSKELLLGRRLPMETGWTSVTANIGSVSNKGYELAMSTVNIETKNLTWETSFTFSKNTNAIEELYGSKEDDLGNNWFIGEPVNVNYTYVFDGIWKADQKAEAAKYGQKEGQARVKDLDEPEKFKITTKDRTIIGTPNPDWTGSFSTTIRFKGFDLNASVYTNQGVQVYSEFHRWFTAVDERQRNKLDVNYYMPQNNVTGFRDSDTYPTPQNSGSYWAQVGYYKDASFVKIQNIGLGYTFNSALLKKIDLRSLRLFANCINPYIFTDFDGYDPEYAGSSFGGGVSTRTWQIGVNVKF